MTLKNCCDCGKLVLLAYGDRCSDCASSYLEKSRAVKAYMASHPRATLMDVYTHTRVPLHMIREVAASQR